MTSWRTPSTVLFLVCMQLTSRAEGGMNRDGTAQGVLVAKAMPVPGCLDSARANTEGDRLGNVLAATGVLRSDTGSSVVLRMAVDTADGFCQVTGVLREDATRLESRRLSPRDNPEQLALRMEQVVNDLASQWASHKFARMEIVSNPAGASVVLDGALAGKTPLRLDRLLPGRVRIRLDASGWDTLLDSVELEAGTLLRRELSMRRSQAWLDSVRRAEVARRRDSVWGGAQRLPAQALPELFARLGHVGIPIGKQGVAVLPFQVTGGKPGGYDPGVMAAEYGVSHFSRDPRFMVVEREGVSRLLKEQALSLSGAVSDSGAAEVGKLLAARYLVTGTVSIQGSRQVFAARLVSVESGEILSAAVATLGSESLEDLYRTALGERGQLSGSLYRSAVGPGWGQFYTGHPVHGGIALGAALAALGYVGWSYADYSDKEDLLKRFRNNDPSEVHVGESPAQWIGRAEAARQDRNSASTRLGVSFAVLGAVWVADLVDAGALGYQESRRIRAQYFSWRPELKAQADGLELAWRF